MIPKNYLMVTKPLLAADRIITPSYVRSPFVHPSFNLRCNLY